MLQLLIFGPFFPRNEAQEEIYKKGQSKRIWGELYKVRLVVVPGRLLQIYEFAGTDWQRKLSDEITLCCWLRPLHSMKKCDVASGIQPLCLKGRALVFCVACGSSVDYLLGWCPTWLVRPKNCRVFSLTILSARESTCLGREERCILLSADLVLLNWLNSVIRNSKHNHNRKLVP